MENINPLAKALTDAAVKEILPQAQALNVLKSCGWGWSSMFARGDIPLMGLSTKILLFDGTEIRINVEVLPPVVLGDITHLANKKD